MGRTGVYTKLREKRRENYKMHIFLFKYLLPWIDGEGLASLHFWSGIPVKIQDASMWHELQVCLNSASFLSVSVNIRFGSYGHSRGESDLLASDYWWAGADRIVICTVTLDLRFVSECFGCISISKYLLFCLGWLQQLVICKQSICALVYQVLGQKFQHCKSKQVLSQDAQVWVSLCLLNEGTDCIILWKLHSVRIVRADNRLNSRTKWQEKLVGTTTCNQIKSVTGFSPLLILCSSPFFFFFF